jgi:hypothetical protein
MIVIQRAERPQLPLRDNWAMPPLMEYGIETRLCSSRRVQKILGYPADLIEVHQ